MDDALSFELEPVDELSVLPSASAFTYPLPLFFFHFFSKSLSAHGACGFVGCIRNGEAMFLRHLDSRSVVAAMTMMVAKVVEAMVIQGGHCGGLKLRASHILLCSASFCFALLYLHGVRWVSWVLLYMRRAQAWESMHALGQIARCITKIYMNSSFSIICGCDVRELGMLCCSQYRDRNHIRKRAYPDCRASIPEMLDILHSDYSISISGE